MINERPAPDGGDVEYRPPAWVPAYILEIPHVPIDDQIREAGVLPLRSADDLAVPGFFRSDDELDEFLADLYESRRSSGFDHHREFGEAA
jgi:hypothetical protein